MRSRPVNPRAKRSAVIVASVPELTRRTFSMAGTRATKRSAISTSAAVGAPKPNPVVACSRTACTKGVKPWPWIIGPHAPT